MDLEGELQYPAEEWITTLEEGCKQMQTIVGLLMQRQQEGGEIDGGAISMDQWLEDRIQELLDILWELEEGLYPQLDVYIDSRRADDRLAACRTLFTLGRDLRNQLEYRYGLLASEDDCGENTNNSNNISYSDIKDGDGVNNNNDGGGRCPRLHQDGSDTVAVLCDVLGGAESVRCDHGAGFYDDIACNNDTGDRFVDYTYICGGDADNNDTNNNDNNAGTRDTKDTSYISKGVDRGSGGDGDNKDFDNNHNNDDTCETRDNNDNNDNTYANGVSGGSRGDDDNNDTDNINNDDDI
ncbi:hypothetical protein CBR_g18586 [Chara braunii]|uniref:Uncharacterized protein n=1 Tax=Chara braunii TaxID=69332 RepID=A0A388JT74_CHABU|nr:hypothetical protein CBR_g18586 [Chara braunii]|eukprot:GBG60990.1 hypothetical protein CBR_g18586 [Chara braunii]